MAAELCMLD